jgi:hypothetical protein
MTTLADRQGTGSVSGTFHTEAECSIELRCDATSANLIMEGILDVWCLAALNAQLDQLGYTSNEFVMLNLRNVSDISPEVLRDLTKFAKAMSVSDRKLSIMVSSRPVTGWLYVAGIHRFALIYCS